VAHPDGDASTGIPRWLKIAGIVLAVLVLLAVAVMLVSGGAHGPTRHMP
jgi:hypothetical protein